MPENSTPRFSTPAFAITEEQLRIQTATQPSLLIEAAAGAAKTTTLALRMAESLAHGTAPRRILALTFTDTACAALRQTLRFIGVPAEAVQALRIETFESFSATVLRAIESIEGKDPVRRLNTAEQLKAHVWQAVEAAADSKTERHRDELNVPAYGSNAYVGQFLHGIKTIKGRLLLERTPADGADSLDHAEELGVDYTLLRVLQSYETLRRRSGHDHPLFRGPYDATYDLACLLRAEDGYRLPEGFIDELFVDEMHDCNEAMFTLLKALLAKPQLFFCVVGDRDQVIHQQYGADPRFLGPALDQETGRTMRRMPLSRSFRYGADVATWMSRHAGKPITAQDGVRTQIISEAYADGGCEDAVVAALKAWRRDQRSNSVYTSCAVLLRQESQSVLIENALHAEGIAYKCAGFASYLHRPEVLFVRTVYAIASGRLDTLGGAATRRLIPDALFMMTQTPPITEDDPDHDSPEAFIREASQHAAASEVVVESIFKQHIMDRAPRAVKARLQRAIDTVAPAAAASASCSFGDFIAALDMPRFAQDVFVDPPRRQEVMRHMEGLAGAAQRFASVLDFFRHLQSQDEANSQRLQDHAAGKVMSNKSNVPAITLASVAQVKGLEFEHVLLPYLERGVFPDGSSVLADERNLFYVAVTRAKQRLSLFAHGARPSGFLAKA